MSLHGSCLCGAVRIELAGEPGRVGLCHCLDCRKKTGSVFATWAIYPAGAVNVVGETAVHEGRNDYSRHVCAACASPLYERQAGSDEVELLAGVLDEPHRLTPTYELWTIRREEWLPSLPHARQYERDRDADGSDT
jgi:hypothetical protein